MPRSGFAAVVLLAVAAGCGGGGEPAAGNAPTTDEPVTLTVYSGRNENLVGPLLERFTAATGIAVKARYGETAELAATLLEEGPATPADVFLSQDASALGAVAAGGMLRPLPKEVTGRVAADFADREGLWVGVSGRARTVVYNRRRTTPESLPQSLPDVADPAFRGRFGVAPLNASFQAHMAVYRALHGAAGLAELLAGMVANEPKRYPNNSSIVQAVVDGEIDWGLVNHYYLWRALAEDPEAPGANFYMPSGDASGFVNVAGAGVLSEEPQAVELVRFLLFAEAQRYFAEETLEYPLVDGIEPAVDLPPLTQLGAPQIDFREVSAVLEETLVAIDQSGLVQ